MNTPNNRRRRQSREKLEAAYEELLRTREPEEIRISELCARTGLNRSTFYANYEDLHGLEESIRERLEGELQELYREEIETGHNTHDYLKLFRHIQANQAIYRTYFRLGYDRQYRILRYDAELARQHFDNRQIEYHMEFFRAGLTRLIRLWLERGCPESPEEMMEVLTSEYRGRTQYFEAQAAEPSPAAGQTEGGSGQ